jgi:hypothetical protein
MLSGAFTDQGVTASDNVDGITSRVVVAGVAVNVNTAGTYVITYNVSVPQVMLLSKLQDQ